MGAGSKNPLRPSRNSTRGWRACSGRQTRQAPHSGSDPDGTALRIGQGLRGASPEEIEVLLAKSGPPEGVVAVSIMDFQARGRRLQTPGGRG